MSTNRPPWVLIGSIIALVYLVLCLLNGPSLIGVVVSIALTALTVVVARMIWNLFGTQATLAWQSVPIPFSHADQTFDAACAQLLRRADVRILAGKGHAPRELVLGLGFRDLNELLRGAPLARLESIATTAYREQLTSFGILDLQRSPLVSIVAVPGLGRGRFIVSTPDHVVLDDHGASDPTAHDADGDNGNPTRSFDDDPTQPFVLARLPKLEVVVAGTTFIAAGRAFTIGRADTCDVVIEGETASRVHVRVEPTLEGWVVVDANSRHGIYCDAEQVSSCLLKPGATLFRLGQPASAISMRMTVSTSVSAP